MMQVKITKADIEQAQREWGEIERKVNAKMAEREREASARIRAEDHAIEMLVGMLAIIALFIVGVAMIWSAIWA